MGNAVRLLIKLYFETIDKIYGFLVTWHNIVITWSIARMKTITLKRSIYSWRCELKVLLIESYLYNLDWDIGKQCRPSSDAAKLHCLLKLQSWELNETIVSPRSDPCSQPTLRQSTNQCSPVLSVLWFFVCASLVLYVAFILLLFVPHLSFFCLCFVGHLGHWQTVQIQIRRRRTRRLIRVCIVC